MFFYERAAQYDRAQWEAFELAGLSGLILTDDDEWGMWNEKGDPVLHIEVLVHRTTGDIAAHGADVDAFVFSG
jgi:hypothetical protein